MNSFVFAYTEYILFSLGWSEFQEWIIVDDLLYGFDT